MPDLGPNCFQRLLADNKVAMIREKETTFAPLSTPAFISALSVFFKENIGIRGDGKSKCYTLLSFRTANPVYIFDEILLSVTA